MGAWTTPVESTATLPAPPIPSTAHSGHGAFGRRTELDWVRSLTRTDGTQQDRIVLLGPIGRRVYRCPSVCVRRVPANNTAPAVMISPASEPMIHVRLLLPVAGSVPPGAVVGGAIVPLTPLTRPLQRLSRWNVSMCLSVTPSSNVSVTSSVYAAASSFGTFGIGTSFDRKALTV